MQTKIVKIGDHNVGGSEFSVFAGPCSIESEAQLQTTASFVNSHGAQVLRGGVFKLRTSPDSFQGLDDFHSGSIFDRRPFTGSED